MGWIESPPYFCTASETARDCAAQYAETPIGSQPDHPFLPYTQTNDAFAALPGGLGTLDELAEIATWRQIGSHAKPVGMLNVDGYFGALLSWLDRVVDDGLLNEDNRALLHSATTPSALLELFAADDRSTSPKWDS